MCFNDLVSTPDVMKDKKNNDMRMMRIDSSRSENDFSDESSDWGPGFEDLNMAQKQVLDELKSSQCRREVEQRKM